MGSVVSLLAEWWVAVYTLAVPPEVCARRRAELASHHHEARAAGQTGRELLGATVRGAADDLLWCRAEREAAGWAPAVVSPAGSTIVAALSMAVTYGMSVFAAGTTVADAVSVIGPGVAVTVLVVSFMDSLWRRWRPPPFRDEKVDDPIFP